MRPASLLLVATLLLGCATTWSAGAEPLRRGASAIPIVEVWLNGQGPFMFMVDTGAPLCVVREGIAERLQLHPMGKGTLRGAGSEPASFSVVNRLEVGGIRAESVPVVVADLPVVDGFLGNSFLRGYRVTLDYPHRHLMLEPRQER